MLRPYWLSGLTVLLLLIWAWIFSANVQSSPGSFLPSLTTSPWFLYGLPFLLFLGMILAVMVVHVSRRWNTVAATTILLCLAIPWILYDFSQSYPKPAAERCLGFSLGDRPVTIEFQSQDSLLNGRTANGIFQVEPSVFQTILEHSGINEIQPDSAPIKNQETSHSRRYFQSDCCQIQYDTQENILSFDFKEKISNN